MYLFDISLIAWCGLLVALSTLVVAALTFSLATNRAHVLWGAFCIAVCVWSGSFYGLGEAATADIALLWWRMSHIAVVFIPTLFLHFTIVFLRRKQCWFAAAGYALSAILALLSVFTDLIVADVRWVFGEVYYDLPGALYGVVIAHFAGLSILAFLMIIGALKRAAEAKRYRLSMLLFASGIGFAGGFLTFAPVYQIDLYPISILAVAIAPPLISYAILRHRLFGLIIGKQQFFELALATIALAQLVVLNSKAESFLQSVLVAAGFLMTISFLRLNRRAIHST